MFPESIVVKLTLGKSYAFQKSFSLVARSQLKTSLKILRSCGILKASRESSIENKK